MPRRSSDILDCFGVELEFPHILRGTLPLQMREFFSEDHDASIETPGIAVDPESRDLLFEDPERVLSFPRSTIGTEIVSGILNMTDITSRRAIDRICEWAYKKGEFAENDRSGIHVHISMAYRHVTLINLMKLAAHLEQVFYYLGGMGYKFRGVENDFTYCRPITKYGPSAIRASKPFQVFTLKKLYDTRDSVRFWDTYGGIDPENPPGKYYPIRYNWFTLYPLLTKGTVEFRVFNTTLNPQYIWNAVIIARNMCELALNSPCPLDLEENSIYSDHDKDHVAVTFAHFAEMVNMDRQVAKSALHIIERTPPIVAEPAFVYTHLRDGSYNLNYRFTEPHVIQSTKRAIKSPHFVDSHLLAGERSES